MADRWTEVSIKVVAIAANDRLVYALGEDGRVYYNTATPHTAHYGPGAWHALPEVRHIQLVDDGR